MKLGVTDVSILPPHWLLFFLFRISFNYRSLHTVTAGKCCNWLPPLSVYPPGRHVFVLRAGLVNRKPKRGVHSGLPLMHGSKVRENRRHHPIMRSVTVGCSQRSLVFVLSEGHAPRRIKGIPLQTDKGIPFDPRGNSCLLFHFNLIYGIGNVIIVIYLNSFISLHILQIAGSKDQISTDVDPPVLSAQEHLCPR